MYIALDKNSVVCSLFENHPIRKGNHWEPYEHTCDGFSTGLIGYLPKGLFPNLTWEDEPIEVNLYTKEFVQNFGDACYKQGEQDACNFEYGRVTEGNLTIEEYIASTK